LLPMDDVVSILSELLHNYPGAQTCRDYLDKRLSRSSQLHFGFGFFPDQANLHLLIDAIGEQRLAELELIVDYVRGTSKERHGHLEKHNLVIPYKDLYGRTIALAGRSLLDDEERRAAKIPKYKNTIFKKGNHLFGLNEAKKAILDEDAALVVEGQMDCFKAHEAGLHNIVALGNSNMTFIQLSLFTRLTKNIYLLLDSDEPGQIGTSKIKANFSRFANITSLSLPAGYKDIDELAKEASGNEIREALGLPCKTH
jgi:DNA primase